MVRAGGPAGGRAGTLPAEIRATTGAPPPCRLRLFAPVPAAPLLCRHFVDADAPVLCQCPLLDAPPCRRFPN
jgi:hypothetical protein